MTEAALIEQFVATFGKFNDMTLRDQISLPAEMDGGRDDSPYARQKWKPAFIPTEPAALADIYRLVPNRFPSLYEQLVLSYRWLEVDLDGIVTLFPNAPGPSLTSLLDAIIVDPILVHVLFPQGFIPIGKVPDSYDRVCFDTKNRQVDGDCPIVGIEHEALLCQERIGKKWQIADSFRSFMEMLVHRTTVA